MLLKAKEDFKAAGGVLPPRRVEIAVAEGGAQVDQQERRIGTHADESAEDRDGPPGNQYVGNPAAHHRVG